MAIKVFLLGQLSLQHDSAIVNILDNPDCATKYVDHFSLFCTEPSLLTTCMFFKQWNLSYNNQICASRGNTSFTMFIQLVMRENFSPLHSELILNHELFTIGFNSFLKFPSFNILFCKCYPLFNQICVFEKCWLKRIPLGKIK